MSHNEVQILTEQLNTLSLQFHDLNEMVKNHIKKSDEHIESMKPIIERIDALTIAGDTVETANNAKAVLVWWSGVITPLVIIGGALLTIYKYLK
jgi:hypothetical protein